MERYAHPSIQAEWSIESKLARWIQVEQAAASALDYELLADALSQMLADGLHLDRGFHAELVVAEARTHHDVAAFVEVLEQRLEKAGCTESRFVHFGLTSSDVTDTALHMTLEAVGKRIDQQIGQLWNAIFRNQPSVMRIARTHGQAAEEVAATYWVRSMMAELDRERGRFGQACAWIGQGQLSGPVGEHPYIDPAAEEHALLGIELEAADDTTQVINRDYILAYLHSLSRLSRILQLIATWIRFESISGVDQIRLRPPGDGYQGSSSMPHKVNPTQAERICGLAQLVRGMVRSVEDASVGWADHTLEHSSVERVTLPLITTYTGYMLDQCAKLWDRIEWVPSPDPGRRSSFKRMHDLIIEGHSRAEAHRIVRSEYGIS